MVETFPDAEIWCLWNDAPELRYPGRLVCESWLARTTLRHAKAVALPLMPATWRTHRSTSGEWILANSHLFAHHVRLGGDNPDVRKFAYVHTPARYIWTPELDGRGTGWLPRLISPSLRALDRRRAQESYRIAANSTYVQARIQVAWNRDSEVIYPPVDVSQIQGVQSWADQLSEAERALLDRLPRPFVLGASRFIPYKRLDVVIKTGEAMDVPVVLAGSGPEGPRLREQASQATVPVHFVDTPSDALLYALYEAASLFVFPAIEDFGIMPVEAMATGTPVLGRRVGGVSETVIDGVTGALLDTLDSPRCLAAGASAALSAEPDACRARAQVFDSENFSRTLRDWMGVSTASARLSGKQVSPCPPQTRSDA